MLVKIYGADPTGEKRYSPAECIGAVKHRVEGNPDPKHVSTNFAERQNLTLRMQSRRFTRLTNAFSKKLENHALSVALHYMHYNFCRIHKTLRITPAMAAGVTDHVWTRSAPHELQRSAMSRQSEGMRVDGFAGKRWRRQGIVCRVRPPVARACPAKGRYGAQSAQDAKFKLRHYRYWGEI
jgi:hypothetical protein